MTAQASPTRGSCCFECGQPGGTAAAAAKLKQIADGRHEMCYLSDRLLKELRDLAGFANEGQLLLVNAASLAELRQRLPPDPAAKQVRAVLADSGGSGSMSSGGGGGGSAVAPDPESAAGKQLSADSTGSGGGSAFLPASGSDSSQQAVAAPPTTRASHPAAAAAAATAGHPAAPAHPADVARFRPNLLVEGPPPFAEDGWSSVRIGPHTFSVSGKALLQIVF